MTPAITLPYSVTTSTFLVKIMSKSYLMVFSALKRMHKNHECNFHILHYSRLNLFTQITLLYCCCFALSMQLLFFIEENIYLTVDIHLLYCGRFNMHMFRVNETKFSPFLSIVPLLTIERNNHLCQCRPSMF